MADSLFDPHGPAVVTSVIRQDSVNGRQTYKLDPPVAFSEGDRLFVDWGTEPPSVHVYRVEELRLLEGG